MISAKSDVQVDTPEVDGDPGIRGVGVPDDIGQCLLHDPVGGQVDPGR